MNERKHLRAITGLILLALIATVALGLQERRSAPLSAYSPASPVRSGRPTLRPLSALGAVRWLQSVGTRAFWTRPGPWIAVGLTGFGLLAWGIIAAWAVRERGRGVERD
jgi:hypothetical protein